MGSRGPLFTVITVTYNAEKWLEQTVLSVGEQVGVSLEYLIIDGGSKDGTLEIIRRYPEIVTAWVSEPDKGLYDAMNKGLRKATGEYVLFLNAGDTLQEKDCIRQLSEIALAYDFPDIIYGETDLVNAKGEFIGHRRLKAQENLTWKTFRWGMLVCHQAFIVRRKMAPLYDLTYRFSADFDWCIRCMKQAGLIVNSRLRLVNYLYEGMTTANRRASLKERYRIMQKYYGKIPVALLHIWFAMRFYWAKCVKKAV